VPEVRLNIRFLAWLTAGCLLFAGAWYAVHRFQVRRQASDLRDQADTEESQGRSDRAARFLGLYLGLVPDDTEARARYGWLLDRLAKDSPRKRAGAMAVFEQVLLRDPDRQDVRRRLVVLLVERSQFDDALQHLGYLRKALPEDGEVEYLNGRCLEGRAEYAKATPAYQRAIRHTPDRAEAYLRLAKLLRDRLVRPDEAKDVLEKMVEANQQSFRAYLERARFQIESDQSAEALTAAERDVTEARRLAPDEVEVLLTAAEVAQKRPNGVKDARNYLEQALRGHPRAVRVYAALAALESAEGKRDEAAKYLRQGLAALPGQPDLLWNLANLLIHQGNLNEAEKVVAQVRAADIPHLQVAYLEAALQFKSGEWLKASKSLEAIRPLVTDSRDLTVQCDLLLGQCFEKLGDFDRQVLAYRRIIALDPFQVPARFGLTVALLRLGRIDEAFEECQPLTSLPRPPAGAWVLMARLMVLQNLRLPAAQRQWEKVEAVLARALEANPGSTDVPILRAEVEVARKDIRKAREILKQASDEQPAKSELWIALADLAEREGKPEIALQIMDEAEKQKAGNGVDLRLARARYLAGLGDSKVGPALAKLEEGLDSFAKEDRARLLSGLAETHHYLKQPEEARRLLTQAASLMRPNDLAPQLRLFDLALEIGDETGMTGALEAIRRAEGEGGPRGHYNTARRLIWLAEQKGDKTLLRRARAELVAASKRMPGWGRVPLCLGQVDDLEGKEDRALENYLRAIELGDHQLPLVRRAVELCYKRGRYAEADLVLRRLPEQTPLFGELRRMASEISLRSGDVNRALELARQAVQAGSKEGSDYVWLGQVLWVAAERPDMEPAQRRAAEAEAEKSLRRGVELADSAPDGWVALVQYLARTGQTEKAEAAIRQAEEKLVRGEASLALAQCYTAVNRLDRARELYQAALRARPDDLVVLRASADFYLRMNELDQAKACLRKVIILGIKDVGAAAWARSLLAVVLAARGDYQQSREALAMVGLLDEKGQPVARSNESVERERAKAAVLAMQPGRRELLEAIDILEKLNARQPLTPEDRFLLVQLHERVGNGEKARERILPLLSAGNPRYLAHYIGSLIEQKDTAQAELWLPQLEKLQPQALRTVALKARLLKAQGKGREAAALLKRQAGGKDGPTVLEVAQLHEELGNADAAEELYRQYVAESKEPESVLVLARYLGRQNRPSEALDLCERAGEKCRPDAVGDTAVAVLRSGRAGEGPCLRVQRWLETALQKNPKVTELRLCLAAVQEFQGRYQDAALLYRQVLEREDRNVVALNNLAWLLALDQGKGEEALLTVDRAIDILGPIPALLDTRAVAHLAVGQTEQALADLDEAVVEPSLDATVRFSLDFHRVRAYTKLGKKREAQKVWTSAKDRGLGADDLHPLERKTYEELQAALSPTKGE
jgi:tetratricopeptide (TPR) repeat protein